MDKRTFGVFSGGEHDPDQHDDGHHQPGLRGDQRPGRQLPEQVRHCRLREALCEGAHRNQVSIQLCDKLLSSKF